jgi:UDP-N-acetylglucosamine transferase subunit ALG13
MHPDGFERLVKQMDEVAGRIDEEVIMQIGGTRYTPRNAKYFGFATEQEIKELLSKARVVVGHGGVGTIVDVLQAGKPLVVVPRLKEYGEVIDDHQLDFARQLEKEGRVTGVYDMIKLEEALRKIDSKPVKLVRDKKLVNTLKKYIELIDHG